VCEKYEACGMCVRGVRSVRSVGGVYEECVKSV
jgi:hypothetical protein